MVLIEQVSALLDYLESHQDLALGHCSRTNEGRSLSKRYWTECTQILNSVSVDCPNKTAAGWRTFFNEYKSKLLRKIKSHKRELSATGGGPAKKIILTPLQERLYTILGRDVGEPIPGVRHNPLTPVIMLHEVDACRSTSTINIANSSFSLLDNFTIPVDEQELVENLQQQKTSTTEQEQDPIEGRASPIVQPPKRRRRHISTRRNAVEDRANKALEAAQAKLETIEAKNADATLQQAQATLQHAQATLQHAQATNNLADAIRQLSSATGNIVDLIGEIVAKRDSTE